MLASCEPDWRCEALLVAGLFCAQKSLLVRGPGHIQLITSLPAIAKLISLVDSNTMLDHHYSRQ